MRQFQPRSKYQDKLKGHWPSACGCRCVTFALCGCLQTPCRDQRLYCADLTKPGSDPRVITKPAAEGQQYRFADACWDASRERLVAVMEHHTRMDDPGSVHNSIVAIGKDAVHHGIMKLHEATSSMCSLIAVELI